MPIYFYSQNYQTSRLQDFGQNDFFLKIVNKETSGVRGREVQRRPCNL